MLLHSFFYHFCNYYSCLCNNQLKIFAPTFYKKLVGVLGAKPLTISYLSSSSSFLHQGFKGAKLFCGENETEVSFSAPLSRIAMVLNYTTTPYTYHNQRVEGKKIDDTYLLDNLL